METPSSSKSARLQELIHRRDRVLAVLHPPSAAHARIMEGAGCEALFVGTGGVVGAYTGLADVGTATMSECVTIAGWIADSVSIPVIMDGDTGHGGIMAVRRMIRECIRAGIAGIRIDDQPIEGKRKTQSAGVEVVPLDQAQLPQFQGCAARKAAEVLGFAAALRICGAKFLGFFRRNTTIFLEHRRPSVVLCREQHAAPCLPA
jgi:2-methylisocitrate lyase-like PEP mutase family enzyme